MSFTLSFRNTFPKQVQSKFEVYWHLMHPQTIKAEDIYRYGWNDEEWTALLLLQERRQDVINEAGYTGWNFEMHFGPSFPEHVPNRAVLTYKKVGKKPSITVRDVDLPGSLRADYQEWIAEAYRYQRLSYQLLRQLNTLLKVEQGKSTGTNCYGRKIFKNASQCKGICNTPSTLYAVWPELLPFMESEVRAELRHRKMRPSLPRVWDESDLKEFHSMEGMDELTEALNTMSLIPNEKDKYYPDLN